MSDLILSNKSSQGVDALKQSSEKKLLYLRIMIMLPLLVVGMEHQELLRTHVMRAIFLYKIVGVYVLYRFYMRDIKIFNIV